MRPWQHARSSAMRSNRCWTDDVAVHEFLDSTKISCADQRHRIVLHHIDLGAELARRAFPEREDVADIVELHVVEDLNAAWSVSDWLSRCDTTNLPRPFNRRIDAGREGVIEIIGKRLHPLTLPALADVYDLLTLPGRFFSSAPYAAWSLLMNAAGPSVVQRILGGPYALEDQNELVVVDHGWMAEAIIFALYGRIPDLREVVDCCNTRKRTETIDQLV